MKLMHYPIEDHMIKYPPSEELDIKKLRADIDRRMDKEFKSEGSAIKLAGLVLMLSLIALTYLVLIYPVYQ